MPAEILLDYLATVSYTHLSYTDGTGTVLFGDDAGGNGILCNVSVLQLSHDCGSIPGRRRYQVRAARCV